ncbi:MAG: leucine-rich repeat protein [Bacteroidales bacterium]|nr:leucine-rich repeat protein [Bacteroidales bacterium]
MFKSKSRKLKMQILGEANMLRLEARDKSSMSPKFIATVQELIDDLERTTFVKSKYTQLSLKNFQNIFNDIVSAYNSGDETSAIKSCYVFRNNLKKVKNSSLNKRVASLNNPQKYSFQEFWNLVSQRFQDVQDYNAKVKEILKNENEKNFEQLTERVCAIAIIESIRYITHIELSYNDNLFVVVDKDDFYVVDEDGTPLCELTLAEFCEGLTKYRRHEYYGGDLKIYRGPAFEAALREMMKAEEVNPEDLGVLAAMTETKKVYPVCCEESDAFISCQTGKASGEPDSSEVTLSSSDRRDVEDFVFLTCGLDFKMRFKFKSGGYVVKGIGRCKAPFIRIPSEFNGVHVVGIADSAFEGVESVKSVTIPEGVKFIGSRAFHGCKNLFNVVIPSTVETIGDEAFSNCGDLDEITISYGVKSIGNAAFSDCEFLECVAIPDSVTEIGRDLFKNCKNLECVRLPAGITEIKEGMFSGCGIFEYYIPDSVISIDDGAFEDTFLEKVTIPASVKSIGKNAFAGCLFLASVNLAQGLISIGDRAFYYCNFLTNIVIPESVTYIGSHAFSCCESLSSIVLPESVNSVGEFTFFHCMSLSSVTIPNSVVLIDEGAFSFCTSLKSVKIGDGVTMIGDHAFDNCKSLSFVTFGKAVKVISRFAFSRCPLKSIILPCTIDSIGDGAMPSRSLTSVYFLENPLNKPTSINVGLWIESLTSATKYYYSENKPSEDNIFWHYSEDGNPTVW